MRGRRRELSIIGSSPNIVNIIVRLIHNSRTLVREEEEEEGNHLILAKSVFSISGVMIYTDTWHTAPPLNTFLHNTGAHLAQTPHICSSAVIYPDMQK